MDRCGVGAGPLEVPATLLACAEEDHQRGDPGQSARHSIVLIAPKVIEWGADCCGARVGLSHKCEAWRRPLYGRCWM